MRDELYVQQQREGFSSECIQLNPDGTYIYASEKFEGREYTRPRGKYKFTGRRSWYLVDGRREVVLQLPPRMERDLIVWRREITRRIPAIR